MTFQRLQLAYMLETVGSKFHNTVARRPVARQGPRDKQIYDSSYSVTALQASTLTQQEFETETEERRFLCGPRQDVTITVSESQS
jgi:hypothetical protein